MAAHLPANYTERVRGAVVGAAVGDALGWPQESRSNIVGGQKARAVPAKATFRSWDRNSGTQYARYQETVEAGEYSDDTQLLLAVARSCLAGQAWRRWLTNVELPTWLLYPRGAGRAVITAARAWADGHPPWVRVDDRNQRGADPVAAYFAAGANGAAMRAAPHAVVTVTKDTATMLTRVIADGIATHGHPRALVGAAVHALALRHTLLRQGVLEYGDLIETLMEDQSWQDADWLPNALPNEWVRTFETTTQHPVMTAWKTTVHETRELLQIAQRSLARAALANDEHTLEALGCNDRTRNGSGTITAVAAAYVATRAAARPLTGLLRTAFLPKADTDTLASMTASLLGAIHGTDWAASLAQSVQDGSYLQTIGTQLAEYALAYQPELGQQALFQPATSDPDLHVRTKNIDYFRDTAFSVERPPGKLPDGRHIGSHEYSQIEGTGRTSVSRLRLRTKDGQSFVIDKVTKLPAEEAYEARISPIRIRAKTADKTQSAREKRTALNILKVTLRVSSLGRSVEFYRDILGLSLENTTLESANFANGLTLTALSWSPSAIRRDYDTKNVLVTIHIQDLHNVASRVRASNLGQILDDDARDGRGQLLVRDPDGHDLRLLPT
jgi:ADP-ribosylglycohydrolase/catechol 2,3-dioxygenase-like lactoylglutathione lyase family enzyme